MGDGDRLSQARNEDLRAHAAVRANQAAAVERRHRAQEREQRQGERPTRSRAAGSAPGRIEAHGAVRRSPRASLEPAVRRCRSCPSGRRSPDGRDQHADLAQDRMPTMSTTYSSAPNLRKWKKPRWAMMPPIRNVMRRMMGTVPADPVQMMHGGGEAEGCRSQERGHERLVPAPPACSRSRLHRAPCRQRFGQRLEEAASRRLLPWAGWPRLAIGALHAFERPR